MDVPAEVDTPVVTTPRIPLSSARGRWVLAATGLGSGMVFLDGSVVNVALPRIQNDLAASLSGIQWLLDAYVLFLAALLLVGGALGDLFGRKLIFQVGLFFFTAASVACGFAPNIGVLIAARAVQGVGGALLVPGSLAMIKAVIDEEDSGRAIGLWTGLSGMTAALGPLVGGYLADSVSWRAIFFINIPLAVAAIAITSRFIPPNRDEEASRDLDWLGALATILGLGGLTFGLIEGPAWGWKDPRVLASLVIGVVSLLLFPLQEMRARHPMVPLHLFRARNFTGSNLVTLGVYFSFNGVLLFLVLDLQQVQGYTPLQAGAAMLPIIALLLFLSPRVGSLIGTYGVRLPMTLGPVLIAVGFVLFALNGPHIAYVTHLLPALLVFGLGMSIFVTPITATVMGAVPAHSVGLASGINNAVSRVAALLAIAVLGVIVAGRFESSLSPNLAATHVSLPHSATQALVTHQDRLADDPIPAALSAGQRQAVRTAIDNSFLDGFRWVMGACALLCLLSAVVSVTMIRDDARPA